MVRTRPKRVQEETQSKPSGSWSRIFPMSQMQKGMEVILCMGCLWSCPTMRQLRLRAKVPKLQLPIFEAATVLLLWLERLLPQSNRLWVEHQITSSNYVTISILFPDGIRSLHDARVVQAPNGDEDEEVVHLTAEQMETLIENLPQGPHKQELCQRCVSSGSACFRHPHDPTHCKRCQTSRTGICFDPTGLIWK